MLNKLTGVFESFQRHDVRYLVIGGIAAILYGVPRATFDLDILIEATPDNAKQLLDALFDAGMGTASLTNVGDSSPMRLLFLRTGYVLMYSQPLQASISKRLGNGEKRWCIKGRHSLWFRKMI